MRGIIRNFYYSCELLFSSDVCRHSFALLCSPHSSERQQVLELNISVEPACRLANGVDAFGNTVLWGHLENPHNRFAYTVKGTALIDGSRRECAAMGPYYAYASNLTRPDDALEQLSRELGQGNSDIAERIMNVLRERVEYRRGVTETCTTAGEALEAGAGVCQDYAHIMLALLRMRRLPCRYAAGMLEGEGESHAWVELFSDGEWHGFDPANGCVVDDRYIKITHGRDFLDCSLDRGVFFGNAIQTQNIKVIVN